MVTRTHILSGIPWYEHEKLRLEKQIEECFQHHMGPHKLPDITKKEKKTILGIVSPHAGYSCSGPHAAHGFFELSKVEIDSIIILGTNHTGLGPSISVFPNGSWETPLGTILIDEDLQKNFLDLSKDYKNDLGIAVDSEDRKSVV